MSNLNGGSLEKGLFVETLCKILDAFMVLANITVGIECILVSITR